MQLKIKTPTFPQVIEFNFQELKQEITERASNYVNLVYSDDQIADAKKDRATLNKFVKALSDERIKINKECLKPYEDFEAKIKELDGIVSKAIKNIDDQVKSFEDKQKQDKLDAIKELWESIEHPEDLSLQHVYMEHWLNKSTSMNVIEDCMKDAVARFNNDMKTLANLPEFSFEAIEVYKNTHDINFALNEGIRLSEIQKRKEEAERQKAEADDIADIQKKIEEAGEVPVDLPVDLPEEPFKEWVSFKALLTIEEAFALRGFFETRNIEFETI
jgi:hypothetical protein